MTVVRIVLICLAAALMCAMLRFARPEMAMAISLSVSLIALLMTADAIQAVFGEMELLIGMARMDEGNTRLVARAVGNFNHCRIGGADMSGRGAIGARRTHSACRATDHARDGASSRARNCRIAVAALAMMLLFRAAGDCGSGTADSGCDRFNRRAVAGGGKQSGYGARNRRVFIRRF